MEKLTEPIHRRDVRLRSSVPEWDKAQTDKRNCQTGSKRQLLCGPQALPLAGPNGVYRESADHYRRPEQRKRNTYHAFGDHPQSALTTVLSIIPQSDRTAHRQNMP